MADHHQYSSRHTITNYGTGRDRGTSPSRGLSSSSGIGAGYLTRPIHDTNFTDMLNRTRNNINRISQRYSTEAIEPYPESSRRYGTGAGTGGSLLREPSNRYSLTTSHSSHQPRDVAPVPPLPPPPSSHNMENEGPATGAQQPNPSPKFSSAFEMEELMSRMSRLEKENEKKHRLEDRILKLENTNEALRSSVDSLLAENKENRREISKLMTQLNSHTTSIEILQHDIDSRRSTISKMDSWVRQGETWRNDIENQLTEMTSQIKLVNRIIAENKENLQERVTRNDLDTFRDRMNMTTQQTVLASLSNWNEKIELTVRHLERQVAALRIGATVNASGGEGSGPSGFTGINLSDDEIKKALLTQQPSEILLKGVVSSEVRVMENDLEKKMEIHLGASLRSLLHESQREVREDMRGYLRQLVLASDLSGEAVGISRSPARRGRDRDQTHEDDGRDETVVTLGKYHAARREKEREMQHILDKMDDISSVIVSLQEASESHEKSIAIEHRALERRLEECVTVSAAYVTTMQTRYSELEKSFQEREERMRSKQRELEEELLKGLREGNELSANERMELSQRMILVEKMVESVMERVDMSKSVFEGLFSSSPEVKRFQNAAVKLEGLLVEFTSIRGDVRELNATLGQLQATSAKKAEISEIRERLAHVEPLTRKMDELSVSMRSLQDHQSSSRQEFLTLTSSLDALRSSSAVVTDRVNRLESSIQLVTKEAKDAAEMAERKHDQRSQSQEQSLRSEIQTLQTNFTQQLNYFQTQQTQQLNGALHGQDTKHQQSLQSLQSSLQTLQSSSQTLGDRFDYLQQSLKEVQNTVLPRLETHLLSHQKEVNNLQYEHSKGQLERESGLTGLKEMKRNFLELEKKVRDLESDQQRVRGLVSATQQQQQQREVPPSFREGVPRESYREPQSVPSPPPFASPAREKKTGGMNLGSLLSVASPPATPKTTQQPKTPHGAEESEPKVEDHEVQEFNPSPSPPSPLPVPLDDDDDDDEGGRVDEFSVTSSQESPGASPQRAVEPKDDSEVKQPEELRAEVNDFDEDFSSDEEPTQPPQGPQTAQSPQQRSPQNSPPRHGIGGGDSDSSFDDDIPMLDDQSIPTTPVSPPMTSPAPAPPTARAHQPSPDSPLATMKVFDDASSFDSTPAASPTKESHGAASPPSPPSLSPLAEDDDDSSFQSTPPSSPWKKRSDPESPESSLGKEDGDGDRDSDPQDKSIVRDVLKLEDDSSDESSLDHSRDASQPLVGARGAAPSAPDLSDQKGDDSDEDEDSSFGDIEVLQDHLSSAESSPQRSPAGMGTSLPSSLLTAEERTNAFLSTLDNSFDDSADFDVLSKKPQTSPTQAQPLSPTDSQGHDHDDHNDQSDDDSVKDTHLQLSSPDVSQGGGDGDGDDQTTPTRTGTHQTPSENGGSDSDSEDDDAVVAMVEPPETISPPGKLPKSNSQTFSKELEDVVGTYWEGKGGHDDDDDESPPASPSPAAAHASTSPTPGSSAAAAPRGGQRVIDHSDSALYQLSDSDRESLDGKGDASGTDSDWDDDGDGSIGKAKGPENQEKPPAPLGSSFTSLSPPRVGSVGSRNPSAISSDEDSPFSHTVAATHDSSSSSPHLSVTNEGKGLGDGDDDSDSNDDSEEEEEKTLVLPASLTKLSSVGSATSADQTESSGSLSMRDRLRMRLQKDKPGEVSSSTSVPAPTATATAMHSDSDSDENASPASSAPSSPSPSAASLPSSPEEQQVAKKKSPEPSPAARGEKNFFDFDDDDEEGEEEKAMMSAKGTGAGAGGEAGKRITNPALRFGKKTFDSDDGSDSEDDIVFPKTTGGGGKGGSGVAEDLVMSFDDDFDD